ncbi:immune inhibitor A domain-containing protein [Paludifilum halophilum]|uniref:Peptidase M6 n=1 Tax=Paludifilum halophilum TaxID=1642702 RepID=A0A235B5Q9_9BACL|nr:immune inhibitor A domain-containing protein [Paludifilum halophilum]OYD07634.1 peptidase M6 [Paludifilum halophilum]
MKLGKTAAGVLSFTLALGMMAEASSVSAEMEADSTPARGEHVDWATINYDRLSKALIQQGKIDKNASPEEVEQAVQKYVTNRHIPHEIDTSTQAGKKAKKGLDRVQKKGAEKARKKKMKSKSNSHQDNLVMALIEFPDYKHNQLEPQEDFLYTKDFSPEHYEKMLFGENTYQTPEGLKLTTMNQWYQQQSRGSWSIDGTVTPWMEAKHEAAYYGGNDSSNSDRNPRALVVETLDRVGDSIQGKEDMYDQRDPYDLDGDGNVMEPDGLLDNLMLIHSGTGEEAGGGDLREDAIWSHRWTLKEPVNIPGTDLKAYDYMIQPEDGATGVFVHEYGHNLGLPDLYDTTYQGLGSPVGRWSVMAGGSWTGKVGGTEPVGFDPWSKLYLQATFGGSWLQPTEVDLKDLKKNYKLDEAVGPKPTNKALKINLPNVEKEPPTQPKSGGKAYFSDMGNNLNNKMTSGVIDLTDAKSAVLRFDSWREIEAGYDYLYVKVVDPETKEEKVVKKYDDNTKGQWVQDAIDLSDFTGKSVQIQFHYATDAGLALEGFYVDNIAVDADGQTVFRDDAEGDPKFELDGFSQFNGQGKMYPNYYLVEWRTHNGVDRGLTHASYGNDQLVYDEGMVVWYYDGRYLDNNTGSHPGYGLVGVVDSHQNLINWNNDPDHPASAKVQMADAAFGLKKTSPIRIEGLEGNISFPGAKGVSTFDDSRDYSHPGGETIGKILPQQGLKIEVKKEGKKGTRGFLRVSQSK